MQKFLEMLRSLFKKLIAFFSDLTKSAETTGEGPDVTIDPGEVICYYGCPNSKKAQKLQLGRKLYK